jgi:hypothetical protein
LIPKDEDSLLEKEDVSSPSVTVGGNMDALPKRRRGAPFKGKVSDSYEEGYKVQRATILRQFKTFFEKRDFVRSKKPEKKKKTQHPNDLLELLQIEQAKEDV